MASRKPYAYYCGVPIDDCGGTRPQTSAALRGLARKVHGSPEAAFDCHKRYLIDRLGYTQVGPRELQAPNGGPIRVLTKKSRFGARMRNGKEGSRHMPDVRWGGIIISE